MLGRRIPTFLISIIIIFSSITARGDDSWLFITVTINSADSSAMENITNSTNLDPLASNYTITNYPFSQTSIAGTAFAPVQTILGGFAVDAVAFSTTTQTWMVATRYIPDIPNTVVGMYLTKAGGLPPYSQTVTNSFYPSQHPCVTSTSVCCLGTFKENYIIGKLAQNITHTIGNCNSEVEAAETLGMFDPNGNEASVDGLLDDFPASQVYRSGSDSVQLLISNADLRGNLSIREEIQSSGNAYRLKFFVGMTYSTLLPANAISTTVSQYLVNVVVANSLTISFATQQDYTFLQYVTVSLYQNSWMDGVVARKLQFLRIGIVLPSGMSQNMHTGLVPLGSIRFAIATELPNQADQSLWTNPCYSENGIGMWDASQPWRAIYESAAAQPCAIRKTMCSNPESSSLASRLSEISIPIGESSIGSVQLALGAGYSIYVYFDVSVVDGYGRIVTTRLFVQSEVEELSIAGACEGMSMSVSLLEKTKIGLVVGIAGTLRDWNSSVADYASTTVNFGAPNTLNITNKSLSLESGLITLSFMGDPNVFSSPLATGYYLEIEHLTSLHFLDPAKFETVRGMLDLGDGAAYIVVNDVPSDTMSIRLSQAVWDACTVGSLPSGALSCAIRHDIVGRVVVNPSAVHSIMHDNYSSATTWLQENLLGVSEFAEELASNMTAIVASRYAINGRWKRALYVHPGYAWPTVPGGPAQSILAVTDKLIVLALVSIRDVVNGAAIRRRLLSLTNIPSQTSRRQFAKIPIPRTPDQSILDSIAAAKHAPAAKETPTIDHGVGAPMALARILGIPDGVAFDLVNISVRANIPTGWTQTMVWTIIAERLRKGSRDYCPSCTGTFPVFYNHEKNGGDMRRADLASESIFTGTVGVFFSFSKPEDNQISMSKVAGSLLNGAYVAPGTELDAAVVSVESAWNKLGTTYVVQDSPASSASQAVSSSSQITTPAPISTTRDELRIMSEIMSQALPKATQSSDAHRIPFQIGLHVAMVLVTLSGCSLIH